MTQALVPHFPAWWGTWGLGVGPSAQLCRVPLSFQAPLASLDADSHPQPLHHPLDTLASIWTPPGVGVKPGLGSKALERCKPGVCRAVAAFLEAAPSTTWLRCLHTTRQPEMTQEWEQTCCWSRVLLTFDLIQDKKILHFFLGPHSRHMEAPRLGVESEL